MATEREQLESLRVEQGDLDRIELNQLRSEQVETEQSFAGGAAQSVLQGATLGFSDEIQSVIAAATAGQVRASWL